jgi:hypothetical protein
MSAIYSAPQIAVCKPLARKPFKIHAVTFPSFLPIVLFTYGQSTFDKIVRAKSEVLTAVTVGRNAT